MISETHLRLLSEKLGAKPRETSKSYININAQKQMAIENIYVWEISDVISKTYKISMPGLGQNNYNDRVMIRGKQSERHVLGQYDTKDVTINMYPIIDYLSEEEQALYLQLLDANNIRGLVEHLRRIETRLNSETKKDLKGTTKVLVKAVKKGK